VKKKEIKTARLFFVCLSGPQKVQTRETKETRASELAHHFELADRCFGHGDNRPLVVVVVVVFVVFYTTRTAPSSGLFLRIHASVEIQLHLRVFFSSDSSIFFSCSAILLVVWKLWVLRRVPICDYMRQRNLAEEQDQEELQQRWRLFWIYWINCQV
jgi:hypothetical protein